MKINWGTGIVITFALFISFILYFVVKTFTQEQYNYDLVTESYYDEELAFQNTINNTNKVDLLGSKVVFLNKNKELTLEIPNNTSKDVITGKIKFYRPSNNQLDFEKEFSTTQNRFHFTSKDLVTGRWNVIITWSYASSPDEEYYQKESIYF